VVPSWRTANVRRVPALPFASPALDDLAHPLLARRTGLVEPVPHLVVLARDVRLDVALVEGAEGDDPVGESLLAVSVVIRGHAPTIATLSSVLASVSDPARPRE
jgi:hypothetical protein